ncbi:MAG: pilus assembly protein TadG-related protein [Cellulomonas sp.]
MKGAGAAKGHADDRGSGTVLALAVIAVVVLMATALGLLAGARAARGQAQAAADLAALAGASQLLRAAVEESGGPGAGPGLTTDRTWSAACATAAEASRRNGAQLTSCECGPGGVLRVATSRRSAVGVATARARAGPRSAR